MIAPLDRVRFMLAKRACSCAHPRVISASGLSVSKKIEAPNPDDIGERLLGEYQGRVRSIISQQMNAVADTIAASQATGYALAQQASIEMMQPRWGRLMEEASRPFIAEVTRLGGEAGIAVVPTPVAAFNTEAPAVQAFVDGAVTRLAEDIRMGTTTRVADLLGNALDEGKSPVQIAADLRASGYDDLRSEMIARTESARAYTQGNIEGWDQSGVVDRKAWVLSPEACPFCEAAAARFNEKNAIALRANFFNRGDVLIGTNGKAMVLDYGDVQGPPLHPACLLPDAEVLPGLAAMAFKADYRGIAVRLIMSGDRTLSVTANHMLLTPRGLVPAKSLRKGDDVLCCRWPVWKVSGNPNYNERPARIADVVGALSETSGMATCRVPVSPEYLHGDGGSCHGYIDVVAPDRFLRNAYKAVRGQSVDAGLLDRGRLVMSLSRLGRLRSMLESLRLATNGGMRRAGKAKSLLAGGASHSHKHRLGLGPWSDSSQSESSYDGLPRDAELLADCENRFSTIVERANVVRVDCFSYSGHVYDLQTESGLNIGSSVLMSNCRCSVLPVLSE